MIGREAQIAAAAIEAQSRRVHRAADGDRFRAGAECGGPRDDQSTARDAHIARETIRGIAQREGRGTEFGQREIVFIRSGSTELSGENDGSAVVDRECRIRGISAHDGIGGAAACDGDGVQTLRGSRRSITELQNATPSALTQNQRTRRREPFIAAEHDSAAIDAGVARVALRGGEGQRARAGLGDRGVAIGAGLDAVAKNDAVRARGERGGGAVLHFHLCGDILRVARAPAERGSRGEGDEVRAERAAGEVQRACRERNAAAECVGGVVERESACAAFREALRAAEQGGDGGRLVHDLDRGCSAAGGERERPWTAGAVGERPVVRGRGGIAKDQRADAAARAEVHRAIRRDVERAEVCDGIHTIGDEAAGPVRGRAPGGV